MSIQREEIKYDKVAGDEKFAPREPMVITPVFDMDTKTEKSAEVEKRSDGSKIFLYVAACVGNLAAFTCGTSFGWTSPMIPKLNGKIEPENNPLQFPIKEDVESWIGSLLPLGAAIGPIAAGVFADVIGRKKTLLVSVLPFIFAFVISAYAKTPDYFFLARFLCGLAVGGVFTVLPMYIGEISEDSVRGALGSLMQLFICIGILFSYAIGPYVPIVIFNCACLGAPILFLIVFTLCIPESPHYLLAIDDQDGARNALMRLRSKTSGEVEKELEDIRVGVEEAKANKSSFLDIFKSKGLTKALILSVGLVALQQMSGINIVLFYTQTIFSATGSTIPADISTIIVGIVLVVASCVTPLLVDKLGKRFLLLLSAIGMFVSESTLGYYFYLKDSGADVSVVFWLPILCLVCYIATYCIGFGPLAWAIMGELFPGNVKSVASTATASGCWILAFILTKFFSYVADVIGIAGSFWIFAGFCVVAAVFVFKYLPETTGKSLQEIQDILNGVKKETSD